MGKPAGGGEPTTNLLIVHTPVIQDISDWLELKRRIEMDAPDIEVRIAINEARNSDARCWQTTRPSVVFSALVLEFEPDGGTIHACRRLSKFEQIERLARIGVPVPRTEMLQRDVALDPEHWGQYVVVKPLWGLGGEGVRLLQTRDVATRYDELTSNGAQDIMIQPYIEHSEDGRPTEYRVLTMFGSVLYAARNRWEVPRPPLEDIASDPDGIIASNAKDTRARTVWNDSEIIALGERAHSAFPDMPVLGVDVIRDVNTGKLHVLEVNPGGDTWHFSSLLARTSFSAEHRRDLYAQFDALGRAAKLLIERTRADAS